MGTTMSIALFLGIVLVGATGIAALRGKSWRLDDVVLAANEKVLFDDDRAKFGVQGYQRAVHNWVPLLGGKVRLTDQRLILTQQGPFSKADCIRYVVYHADNPVPDSEKTGFPYLGFKTDLSRLEVNENKLRLYPNEQSTILPSYLEIESPVLADYLVALQPKKP
jgi:hypothetical protein